MMFNNNIDITPRFLRWWRIFEGISIFVGIPLLEYFEVLPSQKLVTLVLVAVYCSYQLWRDPTFEEGLFRKSEHNKISKTILLRTLIIAPALLGLIWWTNPTQLFILPTEDPQLWITLMIFYPLFSALPQELIYRTFFFHRYNNVIPFRYGEVLLSAVAFSFLHIVYDNWWAVGLSLIAGLLFGTTYKKTKSLYWVTIEHVIYGWLIFTLGIGTYFFEGF